MVAYDNDDAFSKANIGMAYGISIINLSPSCRSSGSRRIAFDHLGRPIRGSILSADGVADLKYIVSQCQITIGNGTDSNETILIEPETGYTHIQ